jgi:ArsR family transcriptional regulator
VRVTGISQSRVSTHLGKLREAGFVRDRRKGPQSFYALASEALPAPAQAVLDAATKSAAPTLDGDRKRLKELDAERRQGLPEALADEIERDYSPGRTWQSLALGLAPLLDLGDVLDVGSGDGAAASVVAPYCRTLTCIDKNVKMIESATERLAKFSHARAEFADAHELPFADATFDAVLLFHTLTYAEHPATVLDECTRVLRPGGRLVAQCLDAHRQPEVTAPYGERHRGFSPRTLRGMLVSAGLDVVFADVACRESKKPHLQVVLAVSNKPQKARQAPSRHKKG